MKKNHVIGRYALCVGLASLLLLLPGHASAFGGRTGEEGGCFSCHTISIKEAGALLGDVVKSVDNVGYARIPGLFTARVTGKDGRAGLLYIDFSKTYIMSGVTVRISDRQNVSNTEMMDLARIDPSSIPTEDSLVVGNPKAPKRVFLFTDPECPFCKKLHPEIKRAVEMDPGIVFYIKMMPLVSLHPDAYRVSQAILCEKSLELLEASFAGLKIPDPKCKTDSVDRTIRLARELGIGSTPTLVLPDGRIAPGYRSAEDIVRLVNGK